VFQSTDERKANAAMSLKLAVAFRTFTSEMPKRFRSDQAARSTWTTLFDSLMFEDPVRYLAKLEAAGVPAAFRDGCYMTVPVTAEPFTREVSIAGMTETVITDAFDGTDTYDWIGSLAPDGLVAHMSPKTRALLRAWKGFDIETPGGKAKMFPQPWFVTEIMKGYIAELEFEQYVQVQFGLSAEQLALGSGELQYLHPANHPLYSELYQLYDFYLQVGDDALVAVDMKNWARSTDRLKKLELQQEAADKHERLCALLPDKTVHAVYVNLYGAHKHTVKHPPKGSVRFMSLFVPNTSGVEPWIANENLARVLLAR
jgi:hypothetical protein